MELLLYLRDCITENDIILLEDCHRICMFRKCLFIYEFQVY
jgi:hypothetical protein